MPKNVDLSVFAVDPEGWRDINAGRPAPHLVREAVQNVFDEAATELSVSLEFDPEHGVTYRIVDNVPGGIRDERLIFTIWASDKADAPTKRGRMGRGLKELISVSDHTLIVTAGGPAVEFTRHPRGKWERTQPRKVRPEAGTVVEGCVKSWKKRDLAAIVEYLRRMRPPEGVRFTVNGMQQIRSASSETYQLKLPTVVFEKDERGERVEREPRRETEVQLLTVPEGDKAWVYEMGIPVETIDFPVSIDVGQRVPLREKRDTLTEPYRRELFAKLLDARSKAGLVQPEQLKDNAVMIASQAAEHLSAETKKRIADAWTGGRAFSASHDTTRAATGMHIEVAPLRSMPESVRDIVREVGKDAREVISEMQVAACATIDPSEYTAEQAIFRQIWERIACGIHRICFVRLATGRPSAPASFSRPDRTLTVYVQNVGKRIIDNPLSAQALSLLIHELGHWKLPGDHDEHGIGFHSDVENVGGAVAAYVLQHAAELKAEVGS